MDDRFRPSTLGEILDRTVQFYRHNFWLFVGTAALPLMFIFALSIPLIALFAVAGFARTFNSENSSLTAVAVIVLVLTGIAAVLIYFAIYVFSYAGITQATVSLFRGEKPTFRGTLASVKPRFWTYLGYMLLQVIFIGVLPAFGACAFIVPIVYFISQPSTDLATRIILGFLIAVVAVAALGTMIWLALSYAMGITVCVAEKKSAWESLVRSWHLSSGTRGRIFVTYLLVIALAFAISMALSIPLLILIAISPHPAVGAEGPSVAFVVVEIVRLIMNFASQALLTPISFIAFALFYFDQRIRKEGYDIEWMMQKAGLAGTSTAPVPAVQTAGFPPVAPPDTLREP